jgi:hypothetical protein
VAGKTNGLVITSSRFRDLYADGVNFCNGTSNSVVENSHFRNTGDDALASRSPKADPVNTANVFRFNTVQVPWRANCFAIYSGKDNRIEDNLCFDVVTYPGIMINQGFDSNPFEGTTVVQRNSLIRAGGPMWKQEHGALKIWSQQGKVSGVTINDLLIDRPTFSGIHLDGDYPITNVNLSRIQVQQAGTSGILIGSKVSGEITFTSVVVTNPGKGGLVNSAPKSNLILNIGQGNSGWTVP